MAVREVAFVGCRGAGAVIENDVAVVIMSSDGPSRQQLLLELPASTKSVMGDGAKSSFRRKKEGGREIELGRC